MITFFTKCWVWGLCIIVSNLVIVLYRHIINGKECILIIVIIDIYYVILMNKIDYWLFILSFYKCSHELSEFFHHFIKWKSLLYIDKQQIFKNSSKMESLSLTQIAELKNIDHFLYQLVIIPYSILTCIISIIFKHDTLTFVILNCLSISPKTFLIINRRM